MTLNETDRLLSESACVECLGLRLPDLLEIELLANPSVAPPVPPPFDPVAAFIAASGITDATQIAAVTTLHANAVANGWWDKCDIIYPFVGGNATAHSINLKDASQYQITWAGVVTHNANGITGDGASGYGDTGYNPATGSLWSQNNAHLSIYRRTWGTINVRNYCGSLLTHGVTMLRFFADTSVSAQINSNAGTGYATTAVRTTMISRVDAATATLFINGGKVDHAFASTGVGAATIYVLANNSGGPPGTGWCNANLAALTAGSGFTLAEFLLYEADWQTFQTALGRQV